MPSISSVASTNTISPAAGVLAPVLDTNDVDTPAVVDLGDLALADHTHAGGGGASTSTGAYASRPASGTNTGDTYIATDSPITSVWNGSAWLEWAYGWRHRPGPTTWANQGGATLTTTNGIQFVNAPFEASDNIHMLVEAAPATPYTVTARLRPIYRPANYIAWGVMFRQSSNGFISPIYMKSIFAGGYTVSADQWASPSSYSGSYASQTNFQASTDVWFRLTDDGTNRTYAIGHDGVNFLLVHTATITHTDFLTPDQIGVYVNPRGGQVGFSILDWIIA